MKLICTSNYPSSDLATVDPDSSTPPSLLSSSEPDDNSQSDAHDRSENSPSSTMITQGIDNRQDNALDSAKGKARMCITDEEFARSLVAEDALAEFDEYKRLRSVYAPSDETDDLLQAFFNDRTSFNAPLIIADLLAALNPLQKEDIRGFCGGSNDDAEEEQEQEGISMTTRTSEPDHRGVPMTLLFPREEDDQVLCVACRCSITGKVIRLDCGSRYDTECIKRMFEANVNDEYRFPPRCCGQVVPLNLVEDQLPQEMRDLYKAKIEEYSTPSRLYCSNAQCAKFLGARQANPASISCGSCATETCGLCTAPAHDASQKCKVDKEMRKALKLGQSNGWQRCPRCRQLVERNDGCYHMSCRCGAQFCYLCAGNWGSCKCWQRRRAFLKILLFRWLHLRGNYLVNGEPAANSGNAVSRICKRSWKSVKKVVTPRAESSNALRGKVEVEAV